MVLHKSKWDHKAKISYLKKHGLTRPKQAPQMTPKWSSKKTEHKETLVLDDCDESDWDSEDEALLNHFYPEIGEQNISVEQKVKIKRQIVHGLREKQKEQNGIEPPQANPDGLGAGNEEEDVEDEMGGIYLGTEPEVSLADLDTKLSEFVMSDTFRPGKSRKLLKQKIDDSLLEDYGISSYKETVKDSELTGLRVNVDRLSSSELDGMRIGASPVAAPSGPRVLTAQERQEHLERSEKNERARLYNQIRTKFGTREARGKVLEINNINVDDARQMGVLQSKLARGKADEFDLSQDLQDLIGGEEYVDDCGADDLDELLRQAQREPAPEVEARKKTFTPPEDDDFLDQLLG